MKSDKIRQFMELADQSYATRFSTGSLEERQLGAQLLLSEVLEYVIQGLGIHPEVNGTKITQPNDVVYTDSGTEPDKKEMLDGLADVGYTMFWNSVKFGMPLEEAFELVCDNNLSKFVALGETTTYSQGPLSESDWGLAKDVTWPESVKSVEVVKVQNNYFAVGKDASGKVRKPSTYSSVDLTPLVEGS